MNLAIVTPWVSRRGGGVSEAVRLLARALGDGRALRTVVIAPERGQPFDPTGWEGVDVRLSRAYGPPVYQFSPGLLIALFRARPDIIHVHGIWQSHCLMVYLYSLLTGCPYVVTPHGMMERWIRNRSRTLKRLVSILYQDRFLRRAKAFQILTPKEGEDVADMLGDAPTMLIPNHVAIDPGDGVLPAWHTPDCAQKQIFLFLGRLHEKKGVNELVDAWEALSARDGEFARGAALIFCGPLDGLDEFPARIAALKGGPADIRYAGPQYGAEKSRSFHAARWMLLPSHSEGLPIAILEAWASGLPSIMTAQCNLSGAFAEGAAMEVQPAVPSLIAGLQAAFRTNAADHARMSDAALRMIERDYTERAVLDRILTLYDAARRPQALRGDGVAS